MCNSTERLLRADAHGEVKVNAWEAPTQISQWKEEHVRPKLCLDVKDQSLQCCVAFQHFRIAVALLELMPCVLKQGIPVRLQLCQVPTVQCIYPFSSHPISQ